MDPGKVHYNYCEGLATTPWPAKTRVLVTGANGYIAQRLIPELVFRGYFVRCMVRTKYSPFILDHPNIEVVYADCFDREQLRPALKDIDFAYYLIHSMRAGKEEFEAMDKLAAQNFAEEATSAGIKKIIYLGELGEIDSRLSTYLKSRIEVGEILSLGSVPVVCLHAGPIIGTGSASYELLKSMVLYNRWIPLMEEFKSHCQSVAIRDVIKYLVGIMEVRESENRAYHIGGSDVLAFKEMILRFAKIMNKKILFFDVFWIPLPHNLLSKAYAYWLHMFTAVPANIISILLDYLKTDVVCANDDIKKILTFEPIGLDASIRLALEREKKSQVYSHWTDVSPEKMRDLLPIYEYESANFIIEERSIDIPVSPDKVFPLITRIGGAHGWLQGNFLWRIRGLIDRLFGGVGLQRGRRDPKDLRVGDSLDFWRVEKLELNRELLLRGELISPGLSWLQFLLDQGENQSTRLTLKAHFIPKPFWGQLYWFLLSKFHAYIFTGMLKHIHKRASGEIEQAPAVKDV